MALMFQCPIGAAPLRSARKPSKIGPSSIHYS